MIGSHKNLMHFGVHVIIPSALDPVCMTVLLCYGMLTHLCTHAMTWHAYTCVHIWHAYTHHCIPTPWCTHGMLTLACTLELTWRAHTCMYTRTDVTCSHICEYSPGGKIAVNQETNACTSMHTPCFRMPWMYRERSS